MKYQEFYGSIKLDHETVFHHHLSLNEDKLKLYNKAVLEGKITNFDPTLLTNLRKIYYGFYTAFIYLYYEPTTFNTIGNKVEVLSYALKNRDYTIYHGDIDSTREINFFMYGVEHLDFNSWIEVTEGNKTWVYDLFSMLKFEKDVYYELEHPDVKRIYQKEFIESLEERRLTDFSSLSEGIDFMLILIPILEKNMNNHPWSHLLKPEIEIFKNEIHFDDLILNSVKAEKEMEKQKRNR